jgi:NADH-quinone oxidoreductase subunit N
MTEQIFTSLYLARADVFLAVAALLLLAIGVFIKTRAFQKTAIIGVTVLFITLIMVLQQDNDDLRLSLFNDMILYDRYGVFMKVLVLLGGMAAIFMAVRDLAGHAHGRFEYVILVLLAVLGMNIMISSNNLLTLYMGLELQSLALYILASFNRNSLHSSEAGLKYFILGALSSGILLFGISLIYGFTGTTSYPLIADMIAMEQGAQISMPIIVGLVFILTAMAFKVSAVPFHMWTPDVYQGAPSCVTAFFAMAPKVAAMALLGRVLFGPFAEMQDDWMQILYVLSVLSMIVGAFGGLMQKNIYRLLAYSSIGHVGFALLGFIAGGEGGFMATLIYMAIYLVMTAGTFAMILTVRNKDNQAATQISDFAGLSDRNRGVSYGLAIMMFSMAGIPPMAGFFGKLYVFNAAVEAGYIYLAIIGVMASVVAAYYYLKIIKTLFFDSPLTDAVYSVHKMMILRWVAMPSVLFILVYIVFPDWLSYEAMRAAQSIIM